MANSKWIHPALISPIPGSSMAHKHGEYAFSRPPKHVDPSKALDDIWKMLHARDNLQQLWSLLEKGATVYNITRAVLYKFCLEGHIQLNLAIVLAPTVSKMIYTLGKAKGIDVKIAPKFKDPIADKMLEDSFEKLTGHKGLNSLPKSALDSMPTPDPKKMKARYDTKQKLKTQLARTKLIGELIAAGPQAGAGQPSQGILNMAQHPTEQ